MGRKETAIVSVAAGDMINECRETENVLSVVLMVSMISRAAPVFVIVSIIVSCCPMVGLPNCIKPGRTSMAF